jgi:phospholipase C
LIVPRRLRPTDQDHNYTAEQQEQQAFDARLMNWFSSDTGSGASEEMGYLDGSTVTGLWHYAQFFATSGNSYATAFGPSTPGVLNLASGQTNGVIATLDGTRDEVNRGSDGSLTMFNDADPLGDICSSSMRAHGSMSSQNIGKSFQRRWYLLGIVHGRLQPLHGQSKRNPWMQPQFGQCG